MRTNWRSAISCDRLLLVPYRRDHVARYHEWMRCRKLLTLTGSEPLTFRQELAMQRSWRRDANKCTFILLDRDVFESYPQVDELNKDQHIDHSTMDSAVCDCRLCSGRSRPVFTHCEAAESGHISDSSDSQPVSECQCSSRELAAMIGDVNLFLADSETTPGTVAPSAEVEVMIAEPWARGAGRGRVAVAALLRYAIEVLRVQRFSAKIGRDNAASLRLFHSLGFVKTEESHVFDQVTMEASVAYGEPFDRRVRENCPGYCVLSTDDLYRSVGDNLLS